MSLTTYSEKFSVISWLQPWSPAIPVPTDVDPFTFADKQHLIAECSAIEFTGLNISIAAVFLTLNKKRR